MRALFKIVKGPPPGIKKAGWSDEVNINFELILYFKVNRF